jgi:DNA-binding NarL/FixJ family response regulator/tetratricopeptide (TPR) repeat protein
VSGTAGGPGGTAAAGGSRRPGARTGAAWHPEDMAARSTSPVLVGREEQLATLEAALGPSDRDGPSVVLIGGEAGVGKSRLMREFAARAQAAGARVLTGGCVELGTDGVPFAPFIAMLRDLVRALGADGVAGLLPGGVTRDFARLLPEFGPGGGADTAEADETMARARLFEQMLALLERLADAGPVALVIEDAHWADRSTRDLLAFLVSRQQVLDGVLILVTYRSDEMNRTHPLRPLLAELGRLGWVERMELPRLDRLHADELVARILRREPEPSLADAVYLRADGNPLFIEELLCDRGGCLSAMLPSSLRDLLLIAVQRLPEPTQEVLRAASVGGECSGHTLLRAVTGLTDDDLSRALRPAVEANVLITDASGYAFRHDLLREATLDDVLPGERTRLHTRFAEALEASPGLVSPGRAAIEQAYHWYAAHDTVRALVSSWHAAAEAGRALAYAEELTLLGRVLELWDTVPGAEQRIGVSHLSVLEHAVSAARTAGERERAAAFATAALAEVDPAAEPARAALLLESRSVLKTRDYEGDLQKALDLVPAGVADTARAQVLVSLVKRVWESTGPLAVAAIDEALVLARRAGDTAIEAAALVELGIVQSRVGDDAAAVETLTLARSLAERAGAHEHLISAVINESHVLAGMGEHEQAADLARRGIARAEDYGVARTWGTFLGINVSEPLVSLGRWDDAIELLEHALALAPPYPHYRAALRLLVADVALGRGDLTGAEEAVTVARAALDTGGFGRRWQYLIPQARMETELRLAQGRPGDAVAVAADAVAGLDLPREPRYAWPLLVAAARASAGAIASGRGDTAAAARAVDLLAKVRSRAEGLPARGPVQQADRLTFLAEAARAEVAGRAGAATAGRAEVAGRAGAATATELVAAFDEAASAWERLSQPYQRADALRRGAEAALAAGDRSGAAERLRRAGELADCLGARPLAADVAALARSARIRPSGNEAGPRLARVTPLGLTSREFEVLRLVADGRSNPEIAARLFISAKTASVHVSNILAKVGVSSRGEAAAAAHRLRLFDAAQAS